MSADLAVLILDITKQITEAEWARADAADALEAACYTEAEFRAVCRDQLDTSHRNVHRWAAKARLFPASQRSPEYSYRAHDKRMAEVSKGVWA